MEQGKKYRCDEYLHCVFWGLGRSKSQILTQTHQNIATFNHPASLAKLKWSERGLIKDHSKSMNSAMVRKEIQGKKTNRMGN